MRVKTGLITYKFSGKYVNKTRLYQKLRERIRPDETFKNVKEQKANVFINKSVLNG
jgi:hypothetical protein